MKRIFLSIAVTASILFSASCSKSDKAPGPDPNPPTDTTKNPGNPVDSNAGKTGTVTFTYRQQSVTYTTVVANDGRTWLQQNLGSSRVATSLTDAEAFGDYFQFARWDDGHQLSNSHQALFTGSTIADLPDSSFYIDWLHYTGTAADKWEAATPADVSAHNGCDPCKSIGAGWRLPTHQELDTMFAREGFKNADQAFASHLKLTLAGVRSGQTGAIVATTKGYLWSSTAYGNTGGNDPGAWVLFYDGSSSAVHQYGAFSSGTPVRCILEK